MLLLSPHMQSWRVKKRLPVLGLTRVTAHILQEAELEAGRVAILACKQLPLETLVLCSNSPNAFAEYVLNLSMSLMDSDVNSTQVNSPHLSKYILPPRTSLTKVQMGKLAKKAKHVAAGDSDQAHLPKEVDGSQGQQKHLMSWGEERRSLGDLVVSQM